MHRVYDLSTLPLHIGERLLEQLHDLGIGVGPGHHLAQHADARALEPILIERAQIAGRAPLLRRRRRRIRRIAAGNDIENRDRVGDGARHRATDIAIEKQRHDAGAAGQPHGRADADQAGM